MDLARAERADFVELLSGLTPEQWDQQSLCTGWRVRDVAAHAFGFDELSRGETVWQFVRGGLIPGRINARVLNLYRDWTSEQLCQMVQRHPDPHGFTAGFGGMIALVDGMVHQQDIRRPLGIPRAIPDGRLCAVLDFARYAPLMRGAWRARGVRLAATDVDWSFGSGPLVSGPGESLLMAMGARLSALEELSGPGLDRLRQNLKSSGPVE
ncbi:maleylpyruvate isomerase family mycothiol-dependent enzyme [Mycobacterium sp. OTB74]|uniref:maleylpyruvate isomerase family mycothiol-dependent enzyme n=1 Tax=Mycobacterium sp. OTB74 TaxID=1853452 RepID=UPI0032AECBA5